MTELAIIARSEESGLHFNVEIRQAETTTDDEIAGIAALSKEVNLILQNAQRRSSLKSDWSKQYALTGIDVSEQGLGQGELF